MPDLVATVAVIAVPVLMIAGFAAVAARARRRGTGGGTMGVFEEMWHPAARRAAQEIVAQDERAAPAPLPGDPPARP